VSDEVFIPTSEWQTIKPDQGIPRGLHVRLNIQTGVKEAKLLDEKDKTSKTNPTDVKTEKIKKSIEKLNDEKFEKNNIDTKSDPENLFRSYQEFKDDLKAANMNLYSDSEIIQELVKNFNITEDKKQALEILDDIEYYVHKVSEKYNAFIFESNNNFFKFYPDR
jgi:nucleotide exchange factor SIL1